MANAVGQSPFQYLVDIERRARQRAKGLPREEQVQEIWRGIAFRVGDTFLVSSITHVDRIMNCPSVLAKVPGAKTWIRGLANIRGILLPVIDLLACLSNKITSIENRSRLLIINQNGVYAGLLVDEVMGIKHFPEELLDTETPCQEAWVSPFNKGLFHYEQQTWVVFDMQVLTESNQFLNAAL
ncbi:chemotaxis protein CheW [Candidatus Albibeggiatoa sp. nov. BB20]|uniref:chemotaxis protein CheW n=1 Tax=Candidatus Albibeggiatoa sp. nov. BB20 TaxID=3162723 RepID=UPI003365841C